MFETTIENGHEELSIEVTYDSAPAEPDVGFNGYLDVHAEAWVLHDNVEICLLPETIKEIEEEILNQ